MHVLLANAQVLFFRRHHFLELEEFVKDSEISLLKELLSKIDTKTLPWQEFPFWLKWIKKSHLLDLLQQLFGQKSFRLLAILPSIQAEDLDTIEQMLPFQGIVTTVMVELNEEIRKAGVVIYDKEFVFQDSLPASKESLPLFFVFGKTDTRYAQTKSSFADSFLKSHGYAYGDLVKDADYPTIQ